MEYSAHHNIKAQHKVKKKKHYIGSGTRVSWYQKGKTRKVKLVWIYWSKR